MPETRYSYNVDLEHPTTSHSQAVLLVTPGSSVLDVGAADGSVARPLAARGCNVWAIECDADAASKARSVCERVIVADVERLDLTAALEGQRFDFILLLDVLEHLRDPLVLLERLRDHLAAGGRVIASIPNVTHGAVRLSLMSGAFNYTETGLLDRTHLRFFDRRSAENLFADARLRIVERLRVSRGLTETEISVDPAAFPPSVIQKLDEDPDATTYQFILVGQASDRTHVPEGVSLAERLQRKVESLEGQYRELEEYTRSLELVHDEYARLRADLATVGIVGESLVDVIRREREVSAEIRSELERRMAELTQQHLELRHLKADVAVKEAFITEIQREREVSAEIRSELERRMAELTQQHLELRHLKADLAVKEAFITELRQAAERASTVNDAAVAAQAAEREARLELAQTQQALEQLRVYVNSPGFRMVESVTGTLSRYPRTYKALRRMVRKLAGAPSK